jgi:glycine cleavage system H lipoate-binding protein/NAD-dependent dihydropyrimidine dehydrogenase PreA subunit
VRGCHEVVGAEALGFSGRGVSRKIETSFEEYGDRCIGCGLCTFLCPTGAVQMEAKAAAKLRRVVGTERTCRYMLMGLVSYKTCPSNFQCSSCPYDQVMEFAGGTHAALRARKAEAKGPINIGPFEFRADRSYGPNHTWVRPIDGLAMVGADHFLASVLGRIKAVRVDKGGIRLQAEGRELELTLPIEGEVVRVNPEVGMVPRLVGFSPYQRGWLALVRPTGSAGTGLLRGSEADRWIREDVRRLETLVGRPAAEIEMPVPEGQWPHVREAFFGTRGVKQR